MNGSRRVLFWGPRPASRPRPHGPPSARVPSSQPRPAVGSRPLSSARPGLADRGGGLSSAARRTSAIGRQLLARARLPEGRETDPLSEGQKTAREEETPGQGLQPLRQKGESALHTQAPGLRGLAGRRAQGLPRALGPSLQAPALPKGTSETGLNASSWAPKVPAKDGKELDTCLRHLLNPASESFPMSPLFT